MSPASRSDREAAYFTLLRATEERDQLMRYRDFLHDELARLDAFVTETRTREDALPRRMRRPVEQTTKQMAEAVGRRRNAVAAEYRRMDDRIGAAEDFVRECEAEHDR